MTPPNPHLALAEAEQELRRRRQAAALADARREADTRNAKRSLLSFLRLAWPIIEPTTTLVGGWHLEAIALHLEAVTRGEIRNLLITLPPGCTKSILVNVMWPAWVWATDPSVRWLFAANEGDLAIRDSVACRNVVQSDWYKANWPRVKLTSDQNVKSYFTTSARGHRQSLTVSSSVVGKKGQFLVVDDPNDANQVESEAERKAVVQWWKAFYNRVNDYKTSRRVVIGQRTHVGDLQGYLRAGGGFEELCIPEEFDPRRRFVSSAGWTDPRTKEGEWLRPERFGPEQKVEAVATLGSIGYASQHLQQPQTRDGHKFKAKWFEGKWRDADAFILERPGLPPYRFLAKDIRARFGTADGAASVSSAADYTVISSWIVSPRNDLLWIGCRREKVEIPDQPAVLRAEYDRHKLDWVGVEAVLSNRALHQHASRTTMTVKLLDPEGKDKLARATPALIFAEAGRLWLPAAGEAVGYPWDEAEAELLAFTGDDKSGTHDDVVDCFSYAVKCVNSQLGGAPISRPISVGGIPGPGMIGSRPGPLGGRPGMPGVGGVRR